MSIKFTGVKGKNRLHLIPASDDATITVDGSMGTPTARGNLEEIWDGGYGICLAPNIISCDGAWGGIVIVGNLNYDTGWAVVINGEKYDTFYDYNPIDYQGTWRFDYNIQVSVTGSGDLLIHNTSGSNLRLELIPEVSLKGYTPKLADSDPDYGYREVSEMAIVSDNGTIGVCLRPTAMVEMPT